MVNCDAENNQNNDDQERHYADSSSTSTLDLHTPIALQVPEEQPVNEHNAKFNDILLYLLKKELCSENVL